MPVENVNTLVVGGGQAGLAMSEHLGKLGIRHVVVEKDRVAESWRTRRWDSLVANGPAWHDRFPGMTFSDLDDDAFASKDRIVRYFEEYRAQIDAPVRTGVEVTALERNAGGDGFIVRTTDGVIAARNVVAATGPFHRPNVPPIVPADSGIRQIHSVAYRNPHDLPEGAVLVVGAGSSGVQIADELQRSGRQVYLSVGRHNRPPRRYRGKDFCWWLGALGKWEARAAVPDAEHVTIAVSGARGGHTVDFRELAARGMILVGLTRHHADGRIHFAPDLVANIAAGDADYRSVLDEADAYVARQGLDLPQEPEARVSRDDPACLADPLSSLDLRAAGVSTIIWATGFTLDFGWLHVDVFDPQGRPVHDRGVSAVPGLYFLGLPWLSNRSSSFIWGVWRDADHIAHQIARRSAA